MTTINATLVKTLRDRTGAGVIECKKGLVETQGDLEVAADRLRAAARTRIVVTAFVRFQTGDGLERRAE